MIYSGIKMTSLREIAIADLYKNKSERKTFGLPRGGKNPGASEFLRKRREIQTSTEGPTVVSDKCCVKKRPPVPCHNEKSNRLLKANINYLRFNKMKLGDLATRHEIKPRLVDNKDGHAIDLETSGLVPRFSLKQTFGKVPAYLLKGEETLLLQTNKTAEGEERETTSVQKSLEQLKDLRERWILLENRLRKVSFARPDKRDAIEDEILYVESKIKKITL